VRVDCALLCDAVTTRENLLYILGGGLARAARPEFPAALGMQLAVRIMVHPTELPAAHQVTVLVLAEDGQQVAQVGLNLAPPAPERVPTLGLGEEVALPLALNLAQVGLPRAGDYSVEILIDGIHQRSVPFHVSEGNTL
jgi:hypothetical protein